MVERLAAGAGVALVALASACGGKVDTDVYVDSSGNAVGGTSVGGGTAVGGDGNGGDGGGGDDDGGPIPEPPPAPTVEPGGPRPQTGFVDKVDVLFVVDNSISMADKQQVLASSVDRLLARIDTADLHVGVITSSVGGHGGEFCNPSFVSGFDPTKDDRGELIAALGDGRGLADRCLGSNHPSCEARQAVASTTVRDASTGRNLGFLAWDPLGNASAGLVGADRNLATLSDKAARLIEAAGEQGCGFEAPLEAAYRFLVDPDPPLEVVFNGSVSAPRLDAQGRPRRNDALLAQREAFLRPDSAVLIIVLTDENDCSVIDRGLGWFVGAGFNTLGQTHLPRATAICETEPNDACCTTCIDSSLETQCPDQIAGCFEADGVSPRFYTTLEDNQNLRCWDQKRRFGLDLLYAPDRYVSAFSSATVWGYARDAAGDVVLDDLGRVSYEAVDNPLYLPNATGEGRTREYVYVGGIVGVPWQDLATPASLATAAPLEFQTPAELEASGAWELVLGGNGRPPRDPLMVLSTEPRSGVHPITGEPVVLASVAPLANSVNGGERSIPTRKDLQFACTFGLQSPIDCTTEPGSRGCDCRDVGDPPDYAGNPLCYDRGTGTFGTVQYRAKAYPSPRVLEVLRGLGDQGVPASICPRTTDPARPDYAYYPAVDAVLRQARAVIPLTP